MKINKRGRMCLVAALALSLTLAAPAYAAVQVNDTTDIALTVFIPCAAGGAGEVVDLAGRLPQ